jgi:hypothetical protein
MLMTGLKIVTCLNWSRTFAMFITIRKFKMPEFIDLDELRIKAVKKFKLLGVINNGNLIFKLKQRKHRKL